MTMKKAALAAAIATVLAAPVYAQGSSTVTNGGAGSVSASSGVVVTPGAPSTTVTVVPSTSVAIPSTHLLPGGATVQASSTTVLGGPAAGVSGSETVMTRYWVNVPANVEHRGDFQRWMQLKP